MTIIHSVWVGDRLRKLRAIFSLELGAAEHGVA